MSNFTFLTGASHPEEYVARASELGLAALAIADRNTLAGVVRGHVAARALNKAARKAERENVALALRESPNVSHRDVAARAENKTRAFAEPPPPGFKPRRKLDAGDRHGVVATGPDLPPETPAWKGRFLTASRLLLQDGAAEWIALPTDRAAYARLCRLLTLGKRRAEKGGCSLTLADLAEWGEGLILIALVPDPLSAAEGVSDAVAAEIAETATRFPGSVYLAARPAYDGRDAWRIARYAALAEATGAPMIATADPLMHAARRRRLADVLSCIREGTTIDRLGALALPNAERRLRSGAEIARLFPDHPEALERTVRIAEACRFSLDELTYEYPDEVSCDPVTGAPVDPQTRLEKLAWEGLEERYPAETHPDGPPEKVKALCAHELALIKKLDYARYFLTVRDVVAFAESQGILAQGRGSAANSVVCYALRITAIGPEIGSMVFERFVSEARDEPPDIDVDFEHERREEVIQHIYERYGRERAGLCATVIHFRSRAAIREVGKAMGLSQDALSAMASQIWGWGDKDFDENRIREVGLDPADRRLRVTLQLINEIIGFPRHLSQHVGGFIMTKGRLDELCPIENAAMEDRTVIEWDKDDIDALGLLKVDVLSLGMLTCLRKAFELIERHHGDSWSLATLPAEDPAVYDMLETGDSIGVFQVESRAQINFLPRMRPRKFYDLVIQVAIVRPGPIQGDMVHPFIRRRQGKEAVSFPSDELEEVLGKTLGVPLFQEQAMRIAIVAAGFTPEEADKLRRSIATFRKSGTIHTFRERFVGGMIARGYEPDFAERCFSQIEGFGEYGFPESHAASFALLVYASAWIKRRHPAVFACALLNSQPMGFYAPAQLVRDARAHGVRVRPVCVNASYWDNTLEPDATSEGGFALRLGFRQVKGLPEEDARWICASRGNGYGEVEDLWRLAGVGAPCLERLAEADAFHALGLERRDALWAAKGVAGGGVSAKGARAKAAKPLPLFADLIEGEGLKEPPASLPTMSLGEAVVEDYLSLRLSLRAHPVGLLRGRLSPPDAARRPPACLTAAELRDAPAGRRVAMAGLVIVRQRPGSAKGVIFLTLEDETGSANIVVWRKVYEAYRRAVIAGRLVKATGRIQREGQGAHAVAHLIAEKVEDCSALLSELSSTEFDNAVAHADEVKRPVMRPPQGQGDAKPSAGARHPREQAKKLFPSRDFH